MIRIVLADDHAIVRTGFRALIEQEPDMRIVAECGCAEEARAQVAETKPDVLVLDLAMPGGGFSLLSTLAGEAPAVRLLVLSMHDQEPYISEALRRGAHGYVTKGSATDDLVDALRALHGGSLYLSSDVGTLRRSDGPLSRLSEREREVFLLLARGVTPKQIANELNISVKTVYFHRTVVREKLKVRNDLEMHRIALEAARL